MAEGRVEHRRMLYTEVVYLDRSGEVVATERMVDDAWYDTTESRAMTADERAEYLGEEAEDE